MSKLPQQYKFIDISDYGRPAARWIASSLKHSKVTSIHVTYSFFVSGLLAVLCILKGYFVLAAIFLVLKSILDAADGELSRINNQPSYIGRYLDSIADIVLNFILFISFWYITKASILLALLAFIGLQLQGTLYNYYYVILRNRVNGDVTSRIFEDHAPQAMKGENQETVNLLYKIYNILYITFDKLIYQIDKEAMNAPPFPKWFMSLLSGFGLGFQLLIMSILLILNKPEWIIPFFIAYSLMILVFVGIRRWLLS